MTKLLVISTAPIIKENGNLYAYAPYVNEMKIWATHADSIQFCCPVWKSNRNLLVSGINFKTEKTIELYDFDIKTISNIIKSFFFSLINLGILFSAIKNSDHIHLRCPGNIGLLAAILQIFFPNKTKTAKYAGNWDPNSKQPCSYKLQKWILSNTFLTKNTQVLVYGDWKNQTKNIKSFFTATYTEVDKVPIQNKNFQNLIKFVFVGTLSGGKRPLYAIKLIQSLLIKNKNVALTIFGEGEQHDILENYIKTNNLQKYVFLMGNQNTETIKKAYLDSHFVILPSESEGWPKVVAEGMFWGCMPISTSVSCVPFMLDFGNRGLLLDINLENDSEKILQLLQNEKKYLEMIEKGVEWSRKYTLDYFEQEIKLLLQT